MIKGIGFSQIDSNDWVVIEVGFCVVPVDFRQGFLVRTTCNVPFDWTAATRIQQSNSSDSVDFGTIKKARPPWNNLDSFQESDCFETILGNSFAVAIW